VTRQPFHLSLTATRRRLYRNLIAVNLPTGEYRAMKWLMERWWRHERKGAPLAPGYEAIAAGIGYTVRAVKRLIAKLVERGFIVVAFGGVGRGNRKRMAVDFKAIREAFAPGLLREEKGTNGDGAYSKGTKVAPSWVWFSGLWGRCDRFREGFARALALEARESWRGFVTARPKATPRQHFGTHSGSGYGEAVS